MTTITLPRATVEQALAALEKYRKMMFVEAGCRFGEGDAAITNLRAALAQQAEPVEPVAKCIDDICSEHFGRVEAFDHLPRGTLLYTAPPQRKLVPLTEEEIDAEWHELDGEASALFKRVIRKFARAVEKASWEKNK